MFHPQGYTVQTSSLSKGMLLAIVVKEKSNFGTSCIETQHFSHFGLENAKIWQLLSGKR